MIEQSVTSLLSPLISGAALAWAIWQFIIKKREESAKEKQAEIKVLIFEQSSALDKAMAEIQKRLAKYDSDMDKFKISIASLIVEMRAQAKSQSENTARIEKVLDRHEAKLDSFGKVVIK